VINGINSGSTLTVNYDGASPVATILGGNGTNNAPTDVEDTLWPGVNGKPATFGAGDGNPYSGNGGSLIFNDSGSGSPKAEFSLNTSTTVGGGVNDLVVVTGDFNGNLAQVLINPLTPLTVGSPYTIMTYTGTRITPSLNNSGIAVVGAYQPTRYTFSLDFTTTHVVKLNVLTGAGNLVWNNAGNTAVWSTNAADANWFNGVSNDQFFQLDSVTFDDSIITAGNSTTTVNIGTTNLIPGSVTVNSSTNYTFQGAGSIGGATSLVKKGTSTLTIKNTNSFTGTISVYGGNLVVTNSVNASVSSVLITNGTAIVGNSLALGD